MSRGGTSDGEYSSYAAAERCPRITISGELNPMSAEDASFVSGNFILEHAYAEPLLSEKSNQDFRLWRLEPSSVFYVGGFGVKAQWIDPSEYLKAKADIVASGAEALVHELNDEKHSADLEAATKHVLDIHDALKISVVHLDKLGVDFRVERKGNIVEEYRIKYRIPATSVEDAKSELNKLLQEAWEADNGLTFDGSYDVKPAVRKYAQSAS
uniref:DUF2470 domain-containing protein n=1 Tax=Aureoumbra lagunensis TaxID=44058 RepID=A0A7S3JYN3_9STRA